MRNASAFILVLLVSTMLATNALSHPGATNASGCHTNWKTGGYHCHGDPKPAPGRVNYCHVIKGERRCGYAGSTCISLVNRFGGSCVKQGS